VVVYESSRYHKHMEYLMTLKL